MTDSVEGSNSRVLVISDLHAPYVHKDAVAFLTAIQAEYEPDRVVQIGDECDKHAMSFHDSDPDLPSAGRELQEAIKVLSPLYELFPQVDLVESNHGSMIYRKALKYGIPRAYLRDYGEVLQSPEGWLWHTKLKLKFSDGSKAMFAHGKSKVPAKYSRTIAMNTVEGHYHSQFQIFYWSSPEALHWSMHVGALVDDHNLAFAYNKVNLDRPVLGCALILDGRPLLVPMMLGRTGRWNKKLLTLP